MSNKCKRNKNAFKKNKVDKSPFPSRLKSEQISKRVRSISMVVDEGEVDQIGSYGAYHKWNKWSIFWDLLYQKTNLICHTFNIMHVEKNLFDNVFNIMIDVKGKTKDNAK